MLSHSLRPIFIYLVMFTHLNRQSFNSRSTNTHYIVWKYINLSLKISSTSLGECVCMSIMLEAHVCPLTFWASVPVTATMRRMPLAMASSETMINGAAWLEFCRWLWTRETNVVYHQCNTSVGGRWEGEQRGEEDEEEHNGHRILYKTVFIWSGCRSKTSSGSRRGKHNKHLLKPEVAIQKQARLHW